MLCKTIFCLKHWNWMLQLLSLADLLLHPAEPTLHLWHTSGLQKSHCCRFIESRILPWLDSISALNTHMLCIATTAKSIAHLLFMPFKSQWVIFLSFFYITGSRRPSISSVQSSSSSIRSYSARRWERDRELKEKRQMSMRLAQLHDKMQAGRDIPKHAPTPSPRSPNNSTDGLLPSVCEIREVRSALFLFTRLALILACKCWQAPQHLASSYFRTTPCRNCGYRCPLLLRPVDKQTLTDLMCILYNQRSK